MTQEFEKISAMVDGECDDVAQAVSKIDDPLLQQKWKSYHLTRDLLRNDMSSDVKFDVSQDIAAALENELAIVAPKRTWKELPVVSAVIPIVKQSSQLAMVASVTAMVIFGYQTVNQPEITQPFTTAPPVIGPQGGLSPVSLQQSRTIEQDRMQQLLEQRRHINALIEDHQRQLKLKQTLEKSLNEDDTAQP
ncbi:transcriptional regulator [Glaciecola sp. XM2]|uniref:sigma-E factor negative regulatory protein n=1 Tax=Glaciecola sp. XM2 TaxID=1914931 RepID=UPI001BDE7499|nr:RseA family anti-sigma factor [Glaciecola sp. XM2]MBT1452320.1 transcriptional regulator [Glaciecola sp. XM2]